MDVWVRGKRIRLDPSQAIGKGGEADVFDIGDALKVYKQPTHPDYVGQSLEQKGAKARLLMQQKKLPAFPKGLPPTVVKPIDLATDQTGSTILGYTMLLLHDTEVLIRWSDRMFRQATDPNDVLTIFQNLHETVGGIHRQHVVIGDFNDLNVLVDRQNVAHIIDADSFQFGAFPCPTFTAKFVDPTLCDSAAAVPMLVQRHNPDSDWYAFAVMFMQSLLFVDPYGGMYRPKDPAQRMPHQARPLHRITVFHPEVKYPGPAIPFAYLPDDLLDYFVAAFQHDKRGEFPVTLLQQRWTTCTTCGLQHMRPRCPQCQTAGPAAIRQVTTIRGKVMATQVFETDGLIVCAASIGGKVCWVSHRNNEYRRENDELVFKGPLDPRMRIRIGGHETIFAANGRAIVVKQDKGTLVAADTYDTITMVDANQSHHYWIEQGQLKRDGEFGSQYIGDVLRQQTLFWIGSTFGCGFYRAGEISRFFVFDAGNRGIADVRSVDGNPQPGRVTTIPPPRIQGQLIDATCALSSEHAWLFTATQEQGMRLHRCMVITREGVLIATAVAEAGEDSWLGTLRGKAATGSLLFVPTDDGVITVQAYASGTIEKAQDYPDTAPWVNSGSLLFPGHDGLYVVNPREVVRLQIRQDPV